MQTSMFKPQTFKPLVEPVISGYRMLERCSCHVAMNQGGSQLHTLAMPWSGLTCFERRRLSEACHSFSLIFWLKNWFCQCLYRVYFYCFLKVSGQQHSVKYSSNRFMTDLNEEVCLVCGCHR